MKLEKCPKCGSSKVKQSALYSADCGYVGYCTCVECHYSVKTTSDAADEFTIGWCESRYKAMKLAGELWNTYIENPEDPTKPLHTTLGSIR